jgi:hypothetical protein
MRDIRWRVVREPGSGRAMTRLFDGHRGWMGASLLWALLVAPGLAACTSAIPTTGESVPTTMGQPAPEVTGEHPDDAWPRELASGDDTFSIFQPQYERWEQGRLDGRAAVAVEDQASPELRYGVIWFTARTQVDKESRMVTLEDLAVSRADFPTVPDGGTGYLAALQKSFSDAPLTIALDRLQAELEVEQAENPGRVVAVRNDPPRIILSQAPALLIRIDGQPALRPVAGTSLLRVINTRVLLLLDRSAGRYYVWLRDQWLTAPKLDGPWAVAIDSPASLEVAKQAAAQGGQVDLLNDVAPDLAPLLQAGSIPTVYVSTTPAELLVVRGQPALAPVADTGILEVTNTDEDLFLYTPEQAYYVLLSGRWFRAESLQGPWEFVSGDRLPQSFAAIPESHPKGEVLASVPGTAQAREAVIANDIPQTATISRQAKLDVRYDGPPQLRPIEGTPLQYVVNGSVPVIRVAASTYYALENGVWFVAPSPTGPWAVATSVPSVIYTIPVSSPLHYVTYAYVYGSTPDVVYTGYTAGYLGTVVAPGPVVVYGTGYDYADWAGTFWYPGPVTWGWGPFDLGFGVDIFTDFEFGFAFRHHFRHHILDHVNVFHHWGDRVRLAARPSVGQIGGTGRVGRSGIDAYAGRDGHVFQREGGQWLRHNRAGGWEGVRGSTAEHEQWHQARQLGAQRLAAPNRGLGGGRVTGGGFRGGGGFHGGGGFAGAHGGGGRGR